MILRPAGRFFTSPFPPGPLAARFLAAVIRPPLLFFAIMNVRFLLLHDDCRQERAPQTGPWLWGVTLTSISGRHRGWGDAGCRFQDAGLFSVALQAGGRFTRRAACVGGAGEARGRCKIQDAGFRMRDAG